MKKILESFTRHHSETYLHTVSDILYAMTAEEILSIPAIRIDDEFRRVVEMHGCVFSIIKDGNDIRFYSLGGMPYRLA